MKKKGTMFREKRNTRHREETGSRFKNALSTVTLIIKMIKTDTKIKQLDLKCRTKVGSRMIEYS
jgi:hypothetical protein